MLFVKSLLTSNPCWFDQRASILLYLHTCGWSNPDVNRYLNLAKLQKYNITTIKLNKTVCIFYSTYCSQMVSILLIHQGVFTVSVCRHIISAQVTFRLMHMLLALPSGMQQTWNETRKRIASCLPQAISNEACIYTNIYIYIYMYIYIIIMSAIGK